MARLGDVCEILDSKRIPITASNRKAGIYPYYGANGIQDYVDDYIFDDELVLLAEDGGHFGSTDKPIAYRVSGKCWVNNHAHVLKPKAILDVDYLCYSLMFRDVSNVVNGATRQKLTQADMREIEIPLLTLGEQLAIVEKLNKIFALISLRKQQLSKLDELVKSRFIELFGDSTHSRNRVLFEDISVFVTVGIANSATHAYADNGIVMLRNQNIKENYLDEKDLIHITPDFAEKYGSKQLSENDILVIRTGYPGVACLVPKKYEGCQTFTTLIVRLKNSTSAHANYVCHYINSSFGKDYVEQSKVGVAQQNFGAKALAKMPIVVPPMELQEEFATFVEQVDKSKFEIQKSLEKLETLKKALMQKYFG